MESNVQDLQDTPRPSMRGAVLASQSLDVKPTSEDLRGRALSKLRPSFPTSDLSLSMPLMGFPAPLFITDRYGRRQQAERAI